MHVVSKNTCRRIFSFFFDKLDLLLPKLTVLVIILIKTVAFWHYIKPSTFKEPYPSTKHYSSKRNIDIPFCNCNWHTKTVIKCNFRNKIFFFRMCNFFVQLFHICQNINFGEINNYRMHHTQYYIGIWNVQAKIDKFEFDHFYIILHFK